MNEKKEQYEQATATHINERKKLEERIAQLEVNRGSGATGNNGPTAPVEKNPFSKEHRNLTKQTEITKKDPAKAAALKKAAEAN